MCNPYLDLNSSKSTVKLTVIQSGSLNLSKNIMPLNGWDLFALESSRWGWERGPWLMICGWAICTGCCFTILTTLVYIWKFPWKTNKPTTQPLKDKQPNCPNIKMGKGPQQTFRQRKQTNSQQHMRRCSTLLVNREMQIKTIVNYHFTAIRMHFIFKNGNSKCWWGGGEIRNLICIAGGNVKWCSHSGKVWQFLN